MGIDVLLIGCTAVNRCPSPSHHQTMKKLGLLLVVTFSLYLPATAQTVVKVDATKSGDMLMPYIYGQFIEHLGRCINGGGIWAEMLEDRKFYYPVGSEE